MKWGWLTCIFAIALGSCVREGSRNNYIARVDDAVLTAEELAGARDSLTGLPYQAREYVNEWIATQLLYQEAERRGLADTDQVQRQLQETKKRLAIGALLDEELFSESSFKISEEDVLAAFKKEPEAYRLKEDVASISFALFSERDVANLFRTKLLRGSSWPDAVAQIQRDSLLAFQLLQVAKKQYFTQANLYPEELWKLSRALTKDDVSFVLRTNVGYYVLIVHGFKRQGEIPDFDYLKDEIKDRILIQKRRLRYEQLMAQLRARHSVEVHIDLGDTTDTGS